MEDVTIKEGYGSKPLKLRIAATHNGHVELWIESESVNEGRELLSYMSADELLHLHQMLKIAARDLFNI